MNTKQKSVISSSPADRPVCGVLFCPQCGKYVKQHTRHKRRFCSDRCRMKYWNSHPDLIRRMAYYTITCQNCGMELEVIDHVTVHRDGELTFKFQNGSELRV